MAYKKSGTSGKGAAAGEGVEMQDRGGLLSPLYGDGKTEKTKDPAPTYDLAGPVAGPKSGKPTPDPLDLDPCTHPGPTFRSGGSV